MSTTMTATATAASSLLGSSGIEAADLRLLLIHLICFVAAITVHEFAHAFAANRLGDPTPEAEGRLNLNPISHADLVGTIVMPIVVALSWPGGGMFGWGRPVGFNARYFSRKVTMRLGTAIVAIAGPLSNLALAVLTLVTLFVLGQAGVVTGPAMVQALAEREVTVGSLLASFYLLNILLFVFNLIPLHPLDGGKVLTWLMGPSFDPIDAFLARWGGLILLGLVLSPVPILGYLLGPIIEWGFALLVAVV